MASGLPSPSCWIIVTGGGSGIGRALVHHFSRTHRVLTCGRRASALRETAKTAPCPSNVITCDCDIGSTNGRDEFVARLPTDARVELLVQNAAIGDPAPLTQLDVRHFEQALAVNVVAPLALFQSFLPHLQRGKGRVLHLGTSVAFHPQPGTATYGITKMAFHRLYQQLNAEWALTSSGSHAHVPVGSLSPGVVDTEGVREHVAQARVLGLPHVRFFDDAFRKQRTTPIAELLDLVDEMRVADAADFAAREWRFSEWRAAREARDANGPRAARKVTTSSDHAALGAGDGACTTRRRLAAAAVAAVAVATAAAAFVRGARRS